MDGKLIQADLVFGSAHNWLKRYIIYTPRGYKLHSPLIQITACRPPCGLLRPPSLD